MTGISSRAASAAPEQGVTHDRCANGGTKICLTCRPIARYYSRQPTMYISVLLGLPATAFAGTFIGYAYGMFHSLFLTVIGIPVLCFAIHFLIAPLRFRWRAAHMTYSVSGDGVWIHYRGRPVRHFPLEAFDDGFQINIRRHHDGSGDITLPVQTRGTTSGFVSETGGYQEYPDTGFHGIPNIDAFLAAICACTGDEQRG